MGNNKIGMDDQNLPYTVVFYVRLRQGDDRLKGYKEKDYVGAK